MYKDKNPIFSFMVLLKPWRCEWSQIFLKKEKKNTTFVQREEKKKEKESTLQADGGGGRSHLPLELPRWRWSWFPGSTDECERDSRREGVRACVLLCAACVLVLPHC